MPLEHQTWQFLQQTSRQIPHSSLLIESYQRDHEANIALQGSVVTVLWNFSVSQDFHNPEYKLKRFLMSTISQSSD